jgi:hypothetical protein
MNAQQWESHRKRVCCKIGVPMRILSSKTIESFLWSLTGPFILSSKGGVKE